MVISTIGMPPWVTASAAKCASSAEETRIAGMMPIFLICSQTSALFMVEILIVYQATYQPERRDRFLLHTLRLRLRKLIAFPRHPNIQRRQKENAQQQRAREPAYNHARRRPLRI